MTASDSNTESDLGWGGKSSPHPAPSSAGNAILHVPWAPGPPSEKAGGPQDVRWVCGVRGEEGEEFHNKWWFRSRGHGRHAIFQLPLREERNQRRETVRCRAGDEWPKSLFDVRVVVVSCRV